MNAEAKHIRKVLANQLSDLSDSFGASVGNMDKLADVQKRIGQLLDDDGSSEHVIRQVLKDRLDAGDMPAATYQLINSMIDRIVSEDTPTSPGNISYNWNRPPELHDVPMDVRASVNTPSASVPAVAAVEPTTVEPAAAKPATADDQVQVGSVLRDRFLLQKRISGGNMGVVYKALDRRLAEIGATDPSVAIKVLSPKLANNAAAFRALQQEATKGRCLAHPGIVRFIDFDREGDVYFIVMEWLEGRTLAEILDSPTEKKIEIGQSLEIVRQIGAALVYAHSCGIVHADVKPGNIMKMPDGAMKLFDFGIARVRQSHRQASDDFDPGVLGAVTPAYSSMQVLSGEDPVPSDDVFSLGCLFYRLVAGHRVFGPKNAVEAADAGLRPQRVASLPDRQWAALAKALSYSRVTRFATVAQFLRELDFAAAPGAAPRDAVPASGAPGTDAADGTAADPVVVSADDGLVRRGKHRSKLLLGILLALLAASVFGGYRFGIFDTALERFDTQALPEPLRRLLAAMPGGDEDSARDADGPASGALAGPNDETVTAIGTESSADVQDAGTPGIDDAGPADPALESVADTREQAEVPPRLAESGRGAGAGFLDEAPGTGDFEVLDFSLLPPADVDISLIESANDSAPVIVSLREDGEPVTIDLLRTGTLELPLQIRVEEVGYSGNRSPWASGQYELSTGAFIEIPARQDRARVMLSMASDPLREADQLSTLRVRQVDSTRTQLAAMEIVLEDDDQRRFESGLPPNTVAFAVSQIAVRESDPAAQIDVLRFNPDDQPVVVGYSVHDVTAAEGADYFAPGGYSISFGPGQRSARLLIPLVQDSLVETDEAFVVELATLEGTVSDGVFQRIVVMIRDDDVATR